MITCRDLETIEYKSLSGVRKGCYSLKVFISLYRITEVNALLCVADLKNFQNLKCLKHFQYVTNFSVRDILRLVYLWCITVATKAIFLIFEMLSNTLFHEVIFI